MKTLFIDLSSHQQSLAVVDGPKALAVFHFDSKTGEEDLMTAIKKLLEKAHMKLQDIDRIAATIGPGGFMSLRVGISLANALSDGLGVPLAGIHLSDLWAARLHPHSLNSSLPPSPDPFPHRGKGNIAAEIVRKQSIYPMILQFARQMRRKPTHAEKTLWKRLRFDQLGVRFRRQHPVRSRILDFYCHDVRLGIELDGETHDRSVQQQYDQDRTEALDNEFNIRILRFRNEEVLNDIDRVIAIIRKNLASSPPPSGEGLGVGEYQEEEKSGVRVLWIHSTKHNLMFVRGLGKGAEEWKEPTLEKIDDMKAMLTSNTLFVGELIETQQKELPMLQRLEEIAAIEDILPKILDKLAYEKKLLMPWYGRGA